MTLTRADPAPAPAAPPVPQGAHQVVPLPAPGADLAVRAPTADEEPLHRAAVDAAYGFPFRPPGAAQEARLAAMTPPRNKRVVVLRDQGGTERIIGGQIRFDTALSLPGGARVPVGALSAVGVDPSAQGRGAFRALVRDHLDECRARGDAASVLMASVSALYGRFGYGCAVHTADWQIDGPATALREDAPTSGPVHVEHARGEALHEVLDGVWRASGSARAGALDRTPAWWDVVMGPDESWLGGGRLLVALHTVDGRPDGYVLYTVDIEHGRQGLAEADVAIKEFVAVDTAAELDLWRYLAGLPWLRRIGWNHAPVDPAPLFWLRDPRQLRRMAQFDFLWLRPLDLPALVAARSFADDGHVALAVADPEYPDLSGRFDLRVDAGEAAWVRGSGDADLQIGVADLGSLWLGGGSARELLTMGRVRGTPAAARRLDHLLGTGTAPRSIARF